MSDLQSRLYNPDPDICCEACVFHTGEHSGFCTRNARGYFVPVVAYYDVMTNEFLTGPAFEARYGRNALIRYDLDRQERSK